ncbi:hypothetical protein Ciccas_002426 [Cichlidogyrus casuarinus]|uniref:P-type ATPase C-terminal domain-containing protein n=1 Tax=Cichlidogyrus casuarinus TaxID=1844966 RepID=A0ABD2QHX0_9PLAT
MIHCCWQAASPDEEALVIAAAEMGLKFIGTELHRNPNRTISPSKMGAHSRRTSSAVRFKKQHKRTNSEVEQEMIAQAAKKRIILESPSIYPENNLTQNDPNAVEAIYQVDDVIEFTSDRKRMTVLCKYPNGRRFVISKGAETSMTDPLAAGGSTSEEITQVLRKVTDFACMGLRTLVFSSKEVSAEQYRTLLNNLQIARADTSNNRSEILKDAILEIENGMNLVGVTGVEDKLQDGVPEAIQKLADAGIQIWVLTGDKEETAVSVSKSAGHFPQNMTIIRVTDCQSKEETLRKLTEQNEGLESRLRLKRQNKEDLRKRLRKNLSRLSLRAKKPRLFSIAKWIKSFTPRGAIRRRNKKRGGAAGEPIGLVIDGKSLQHALNYEDDFLTLCMNCSTVLCCRLTPLQKSAVVGLVSEGIARSDPDGRAPVTAAIGDGGNDVSMILRADVGIGLHGKEGLHAVRSADYALPNFAFVSRLILVHGSLTYQRLSMMMLHFYMKCTAIITCDAFNERFSGWSDQAYFFTFYYTAFNLTMTSFISLVIGLQDQFFSQTKLMTLPKIYKSFSQDVNLRLRNLILFMTLGFWYGLCAYFVSYFLLGGGAGSPGIFWTVSYFVANDVDLTITSLGSYIYLWTSIMGSVLLMFRYFDCLSGIIYGLTIVCNVGVFYLVNHVLKYRTEAFYDDVIHIVACPNFWIGLFLNFGLALTPSLVQKMLSDWYWRIEERYAMQFTLKASATEVEHCSPTFVIETSVPVLKRSEDIWQSIEDTGEINQGFVTAYL